MDLRKHSRNALAQALYIVACCVIASAAATANCSSGQYLNRTTGICTPCSSCPLNQIVRKPCTHYRDVLCGPFYEFEFFNQGPDKSHDQLLPSTPLPGENGSKDKDANVLSSQTKGPAVEMGQERWKELCYWLIAALAVVSLLPFLYILITQIKARRDSTKAIAVSDPDDPVVYYDARLLTDTEYEAISVPADLRHIEAQLERNKRKKFINRIFRPGGGKFQCGNEYVEQARGPFLLASLPQRERPGSSGYAPVHLTLSRQSTATTDSNSNISLV